MFGGGFSKVTCACVCSAFGMKLRWHRNTGLPQLEYLCALVSSDLLIFVFKSVPSTGGAAEALGVPEFRAVSYICTHEGEGLLIWECGRRSPLMGLSPGTLL